MKRRTILALLLVLSMLLSILPSVSAAGTSGTWGNNISWSFNTETGHLVISGSGNMPVEDTAPEWDAYNLSIRSAEIRSGITSIAPFCFYDCENMVSVSIPDTVKEIGGYAFAECHALSGVKLPAGLTGIGNYAFDGCRSLTSIDIPASVTGIGGLIFRDCPSLKQVILHSGLTNIGNYALFGLPITSIYIPDTVKTIGEYAFFGTCLSQITLPQGLQSIGSRAFASCPYLKSITLPAGLGFVSADTFLDTELDSMIVLGSGTVFETYYGSTYTVFGQKEADVYGLPGSEVQRILANDPNCQYTFKPMYFDDVAPGKWYFDAVTFAKENSLFQGVGNRAFAPETSMTRAMIVQVLYNLAGNGEICRNPFTDVPENAWFAKAVAWAAEHGVVNGTGDGVFSPASNVTREQIATIVYRFTQQMGLAVDGAADLSRFPDQNLVGSWAKDALAWAVDREIITGSRIGDRDYLKPGDYATRAQVAAIMMRCVRHWDEATHSDLLISVGQTELIPYVEQAAEQYMAANEDVRIKVCLASMDIEDTSLVYRMHEDATVLIGDDAHQKFGKSGTAAVALQSTPYVVATTQNAADAARDVPDMVEKLRENKLNLCLCRGSRTAGNYAKQLLAEYGISQPDGEQYLYEDDVFTVGFDLSFGMAVCGAVTEYVARINEFHVLEDSRRDNQEDFLYAFYPEGSGKAEALNDFFHYLRASNAFTSCGMYPIDADPV